MSESEGRSVKQAILQTLKEQRGVLFAQPAIVHRNHYTGRNILGRNNTFDTEDADERGYVPLEWWVMSVTEADNQVSKDGEGITQIKLHDGSTLPLPTALTVMGEALHGGHEHRWPLLKLLDIGGEPKTPSYADEPEIPPVSAHVHGGDVEGGRRGPGKTEAYYFPPVDVPPHNKEWTHPKAYLGLKPDVTKEEFIARLKRFGLDDSMYASLRTYTVRPGEGWTIREGLLHAPGAWATFEIQTPQDDWNRAAWRLGERISDTEERRAQYREMVLRGLQSEEHYVEEVLDWQLNTDSSFKEKHHRTEQELEAGSWGSRHRIFFDMFYGEKWVVRPGSTHHLDPKKHFCMGIVWSGSGRINGTDVSAIDGEKEFLITPDTPVKIENATGEELILLTAEPIDEEFVKERNT